MEGREKYPVRKNFQIYTYRRREHFTNIDNIYAGDSEAAPAAIDTTSPAYSEVVKCS
jgi:hypothetical protein